MAFTFFFRDRHTLELIGKIILPELKKKQFIRVWDAGCAMGPEPYSLAIIFRENMGPFLFRNVKIFATDIDNNNQFGDVIDRRLYHLDAVKRIPADIRAKYFHPTGEPDLFQVDEEIGRAIHYRKHNLLGLEPVREGFGLVLCKNVLLHFSEEQRVDVIRMFHQALDKNGFLVMEHTQRLPAGARDLFTRVTEEAQIYRKVDWDA